MSEGVSTTKKVQSRLFIEPIRLSWLLDICLLGVLLVGLILRFNGLEWGEGQYLHPDERFLVWVTADLKPVDRVGDYFDTAQSTLNPHNVGHRFFVYGTFPIFLTRYLAEWAFSSNGWEQIIVVGRSLSALFDLLTVLLVFLIGERLWGKVAGILGATFSALAVLQIQQAHFYTTDSFATFFSTLAIYFAVRLATLTEKPVEEQSSRNLVEKIDARVVWNCAVFGAAAGLAAACKIHVGVVALILPGVLLWGYFNPRRENRFFTPMEVLGGLLIGGLSAFVIFRLFQPYAFQGPQVWNVLPNPLWVENLKSLLAQTGGDVDFPPALQWARRPITFSFQNMVLWGMGLPMGLLAWTGMIWLGWQLIKNRFTHPFTAVWGWTVLFFIWQSLQGNPTMRYQLPIYPILALTAGWTIFALWEKANHVYRNNPVKIRQSRWGIIGLGLIVMGLTAGWAVAFDGIYTRPVTRVEASRWIYQNVPGAVNLTIRMENEEYHQPLAFTSLMVLQRGEAIHTSFRAAQSGTISEIYFDNIRDLTLNDNPKTLLVTIQEAGEVYAAKGSGMLMQTFAENQPRPHRLVLDFPLAVEAGKLYTISVWFEGAETALSLQGGGAVLIRNEEGTFRQLLVDWTESVRSNRPLEITFQPLRSGLLNEIGFYRIVDRTASQGMKTFRIEVFDRSIAGQPLSNAILTDDFTAEGLDARGKSVSLALNPPLKVEAGKTYTIQMDLVEGEGEIVFFPAAGVNETVWDDGLPLRLEGFDPYGGIYPRDLTLDLYADDSVEKREQMIDLLNRADYIYISSNRQWGTTTRLPERYPLTTAYYRYLLGCPAEKDLLWCYRVAQPGMFNGQLGFELVAVFQSNPKLGGVEINTQFAEEAFTVYDHPKVLIFKKIEGFDPLQTARLLRSVDLSAVIHVLPGRAPSYPANLMLPDHLLALQRSGGTWAELFDSNGLLNRFPMLGWLIWYLVISVVGWIAYPILRVAMKGLPDHGFPLSKIAGLLFLSWGVWLIASLGGRFERSTITIVFLILLLFSGLATFWQRNDLIEEFRERKAYYLRVEGIGLAFFIFFTLIRIGNPDLWHPAFGGEKPMDFAYFNAILKSTVFPPYNPWYSGGYINYYYYGFVLAGVPTKWLGIIPSIAYNLILPTMFATFALGAFSAGWNIAAHFLKESRQSDEGVGGKRSVFGKPFWMGLGSAIAALILGNLGTARMIWHGLMRLAMSGSSLEEANFFLKLSWTIQGLSRFLAGARLPYSTGDWYWIPSRALPGEAITEFPFFTFLYADPHAHLFALPLTMLALGWCLSVVFGQWRWGFNQVKTVPAFLLSLLVGGLVIGVLRPTNTWDMPTYLGLGVSALVYSAIRYDSSWDAYLKGIPVWLKRLAVGLGASLVLTGLSFLLFLPYSQWYAQGYGSVQLWEGSRSPVASYLTHWGLFFFVIASWLVYETIHWMANTPLSSLQKLRPWRFWIFSGLGIYLLAVVLLNVSLKVEIAFYPLTIAVWCLILLLRPYQPDAKRAVLFLIGTGVTLTLMVEVIVLVGDIGRMNTVFKFYLQAWNLLAISAAAATGWLLPAIESQWKSGWKPVWQFVLSALLVAALLYPLMAGAAKVRDRMSSIAPHGLDGMAYMRTAEYSDQGRTMDLSQDYRAIRWMQENVKGSPVIVEANTPLYRWGSRFSIYTGLPTIIGWDWHQRQQRAAVQNDFTVQNRILDVAEIYNSLSKEVVRELLDRYAVQYIIVGQLEQAYYEPAGLSKFPQWDGELWKEVYRDMDTVIYEVIP
ncbi:protein containing Chlor_Arch_YYY domain [Bellilinea caldifistulae]|uniref:Glycosyltransferase RgtA/B/C/D-like domain-containing protein n=1 Tax=Bellilinea caldifistulae TaxID=360411 RepID=A0A0P6X1T0_9CHLR|nr:DUF2298 domain-containing protein [Bellilinea caldifistulae]KPL74894.1 hypothetical protein AC812_10220 [Bellilinea caldifistulae]GAP10516.1 protein containing Chlor_Arch_YYY domain [Bellilinea caldifistulae]